MGDRTRTWLLAVSIAGMALAAAATILSIPPLFSPHDAGLRLLLGVFVGAFLMFWAGSRYLRSSGPWRTEPNGDDG